MIKFQLTVGVFALPSFCPCETALFTPTLRSFVACVGLIALRAFCLSEAAQGISLKNYCLLPVIALFRNDNREILRELHAVRRTDDVGQEIRVLVGEAELVGVVVGSG